MSASARCGYALDWCWVRPAGALTGAAVRCCERQWLHWRQRYQTGHYVYFGDVERREGHLTCKVAGLRSSSEGRCAS